MGRAFAKGTHFVFRTSAAAAEPQPIVRATRRAQTETESFGGWKRGAIGGPAGSLCRHHETTEPDDITGPAASTKSTVYEQLGLLMQQC